MPQDLTRLPDTQPLLGVHGEPPPPGYTLAKRDTLDELWNVLNVATCIGMLDDLATYVHPDVINQFCAAVEAMQNDRKPS